MPFVDLYRRVETQMQVECEAQVREAQQLAAEIALPAEADVETCWAKIWDKPLYAYTGTAIADGYRTQLYEFVANGMWRAWGDINKPYLSLKGDANKNANFSFTNHAPSTLQEVRISRMRLFPVQGAAQALTARAISTNLPFADLEGSDSSELIVGCMKEFGKRWGHITVMHFLTDLGLSCKPDRWVVRTTRFLGLVGSNVRDNVDNPNLREAIAIDRAVKDLVIRLDGALTPRRLRYVDKILMEAGKRGVIDRPLP